MTDSAAMHAVQLHQAERAITEYPGRTVHELADELCLKRELLAERLVELARAGKAHCAETVTCRVTGRPGLVWRPGPSDAVSIVGFTPNPAADAEVPVDPRQQGLFA